jgi:transcriptional regulator of acetoin/glycerol metabolism
VRELESALARALLRARDGVIRADDLDVGIENSRAGSGLRTTGKRSLERAMIEDAICAARGNLTAAAERIGWSRPTLYRRLAALGLLGNRAGGGGEDDQAPSDAGGGTRSSQSSTFQ